MNELDPEAAIKQVIRAGLTEPFEEAAANSDPSQMSNVLLQAGFSQSEITHTIHWLFTSPYSPFNRSPLNLAPELTADPRMAKLPTPNQRIIQHLHEQHGGAGPDTCLKNGCTQRALNGLAFCAYCTHTLSNPPPESA
jgi:hypothetical protein